jgi:hypothetical protein
MKRVLFAPALALQFAFLLGAEIGKDFETGAPSFKLHFPIK